MPFCVGFSASSHVLFHSRSAKPRLLADVTPVGYGGPGGKYGIVLPVSSRSGTLTLKDRRAARGGEIKSVNDTPSRAFSFLPGGLLEVLFRWFLPSI